MAHLTLAYSEHRPETIALAEQLMRRHEVVYLEEPPDDAFDAMVAGRLDIETYLTHSDTEYPEFNKMSCGLYRDLKSHGIRIEQIEPYLQGLMRIHERFADGQKPADIPEDSPLMTVYMAEKRATRRLIQYYAATATQPFETLLEAVKAFARADAARFRLRDQMRARALAEAFTHIRSGYIEAGTMHVWLCRELKRLIAGTHHLRTRFVMAAPTKALTGKRHFMAPGDQLTAIYIFNPYTTTVRTDLLAARSLIFNKIVTKHELVGKPMEYPHLWDEWLAAQTVSRMDMTDCAVVFPQIRWMETSNAREHVASFLTIRTVE
jgi:hypothetical protein